MFLRQDFGIHRKSITVPRNWVGRIDGFSAHAARQGLLHFAREVDPGNIHLIHDEAETIKTFRNYLQENTTSRVSPVTKDVTVPIDWTTAKDGLASEDRMSTAEDNATADATGETTEALQALLADDKNGQAQLSTDESTVFTEDEEARIRTLIQEELAQLALEGLSG